MPSTPVIRMMIINNYSGPQRSTTDHVSFPLARSLTHALAVAYTQKTVAFKYKYPFMKQGMWCQGFSRCTVDKWWFWVRGKVSRGAWVVGTMY